MITKLHIKNLRCFRDFKIDNITPITLISGRNNVGKSTLLEGIFLLFDHLTPGVFFKLNAFRGNLIPFPVPQILWEPLFNDMDMQKELFVSICHDGEEHILRIQKDNRTSASVSTFNKSNEIPVPVKPVMDSYPLAISYNIGDYNETGSYNIIFPNISIDLLSSPKPITTHVHYIGANIHEDPNAISEWFGKLELSGKKKQLVDALQLMENRISDLFTIVSGGIGYIYANTATGMKMPLRVMGEGMNKLLSVALIMLANPGSILLLDEVENGFHYSFHEKFWELIFKLSAETNCQVFATTHSYECIDGAIAAAAKNHNGDNLSYIRLGEKDGEIFPHIFSKESLDFALKSEMEVR